MTSHSDSITTIIVVPARNEEKRIASCLGALAISNPGSVGVVLVANNCDDQTAAIARKIADGATLPLEIVECKFANGAGVGTARRLGAHHGLMVWPQAKWLLTTDADCIVAPDWIAKNQFHLGHAAGVCGKVMPIAAETAILCGMDTRLAEMEARYERLVMEFYRHVRPGPFGLEGDHGGAAGASLGVCVTAYQDVGGFADLATGEDRDLVRRLKIAGFGIWHADDVCVSASCRLEGRAQGGMADALRARAHQTNYLIDDGLPPAQTLIDGAKAARLGPWPLQVPPSDRLYASDLAPQIARLERALCALRAVSAPDAVAAQHCDSQKGNPLTPLKNAIIDAATETDFRPARQL